MYPYKAAMTYLSRRAAFSESVREAEASSRLTDSVLAYTGYPRLKFSVGAAITAGQETQNIDPGKLSCLFIWFTSDIGIAPLTDHHSWNGEASRDLWCRFHNIWFLMHLAISIFILDFERLQAKLHFQENATTWCILVFVCLLLNISCVIWWTVTV